MPDEFEPQTSIEPDPDGDTAAPKDAQPTGDVGAQFITPSEQSQAGEQAPDAPADLDDDDSLPAQLTLADTHSQSIGPLDTQSVHTATVVPVPLASAAQAPAQTAPTAPPKGPVATATTQATQAAVNTAVKATHQVTAAVQQKAQKITVAPRKAIYRGKRFLLVYGTLVGIAGAVAVLARRHRYFPADVGIARAIQRPNFRPYDALMHAVSDLGWRWISVGTRATASTLMFAAGFRMEGAFTLATWSGDVVSGLIKVSVLRPRPTRDLVRVVSELKEASFPSGHVVHYVTFYGFLFYLVFTHLKQRWFRTALLTLLAGVILLVGPSRIYMGHHWPSDVGGAYLVGTLWLGVIIVAYLETKANYTMQSHPPFMVKRPKQLR